MASDLCAQTSAQFIRLQNEQKNDKSYVNFACLVTYSVGQSQPNIAVKNTNKLGKNVIINVIISAVTMHSAIIILYQFLDEFTAVLLQNIVADVWDVV